MMDRDSWLERILEAIRDLGDASYQERVWVRGEGPGVELEYRGHRAPARRLRSGGISLGRQPQATVVQ